MFTSCHRESSDELLSLQLSQLPAAPAAAHCFLVDTMEKENVLKGELSCLMVFCNTMTSPYSKCFYVKGKQSFKCSSPSELDVNFFGEQSLLSALSLEQPSGWKSSNAAVTDQYESRASVLASLCLSTDIISPCREFLFHNSNMQVPDNSHLAVPSQGKSSTPNMLVQKPKKKTSFDQSYSDLTASQISWDVSLIKAENSSPRFFMDSSAQEQTWSPKPQPHPVAEVSP